MTNTAAIPQTWEELFGPPIATYSRAQAIEDGFLVDLSELARPFKYPVAMTREAYEQTLARGGRWIPEPDGGAILHLDGGQSVTGRAHDLFSILHWAIRAGGSRDRVAFRVAIDSKGNGYLENVDLVAICGPGDTPAPVITIMLPHED